MPAGFSASLFEVQHGVNNEEQRMASCQEDRVTNVDLLYLTRLADVFSCRVLSCLSNEHLQEF